MKRYTVSHPCGSEWTERTVKDAKMSAKIHKLECSKKDEVYIDEYDNHAGTYGGGELTGKWWTV